MILKTYNIIILHIAGIYTNWLANKEKPIKSTIQFNSIALIIIHIVTKQCWNTIQDKF